MDAPLRGPRGVAPFALAASCVASGLAVATDGLVSNPVHIALAVVACVGYVAMLVAEQRWGGLSIRFVVLATLAPVVVAILVVPRFTGDLWSYAMYGRILAVHHANPWIHTPASFPHDPLLHLVGHTWRHTPSVYGPAFTALSAGGASVLGAGALASRLFYQGLAAIALAGGGWLIWRRTRSAAAVAFMTVHPLVLMYMVNGGRNDILVGLAVLGAVVLVARNRPRAAGVVAAIGALVKVTGIVGIVALFVTMSVRGEGRAARRMLVAAGAIFGLGYLAAGATALFAPMQTAGALYSRASSWDTLFLAGLPRPPAHVALALLAIAVFVLILRHARGDDATAAAASLGILSLAAAYTLPGYAAWGLPAAALDHRGRVARIVAAGGLVLVVTYEALRHPFAGSAGTALHTLASIGGPLVLGALVVLLVGTRHRDVEHEPPPAVTQLPAPPRSAEQIPKTLVVVPTLDEAGNIRTLLSSVRASFPAADVLVIDDGSTDGTPELVEAAAEALGQIRVVRRLGPRGLGPAYRAGFRAGLEEGYDVLVEMDADLSHDPGALPMLVDAVRGGADLAIGSRYVPGGATPGWPARRRFLSRVGGWYARTLLRLRVRDVTSGYRAYRAPLLRQIDLDTVTTTGYAFQIEMTDRARLSGAAIREVPIVFRDRTAGSSKMSSAIVREALLLVSRRALHPVGRFRLHAESGPLVRHTRDPEDHALA